jgi:hypothetical protein
MAPPFAWLEYSLEASSAEDAVAGRLHLILVEIGVGCAR